MASVLENLKMNTLCNYFENTYLKAVLMSWLKGLIVSLCARCHCSESSKYVYLYNRGKATCKFKVQTGKITVNL